jgi:farnesyl diphosphate synthase
MNRSGTVIDTAWILQGHTLSPTQIEDIAMLGSLVELLNSAFLVWDNIMDGSSTRRGQPCWYRREDVGMAAINDGLLLKSSTYVILKNRFRDDPAYVDLMDIFAEVSLQTELGQHCDSLASAGHLKRFTWKQYDFITEKRTAFY